MGTTFVIGAGPSTDLNSNFPVGSELAERIEAQLNSELQPGSEGPISRAIMRTTGLTDEHKIAMQRIRNSIVSADSIDDFISEWSDISQLEAVAKIAIAFQILEAERKSTLFIDEISEAERTGRLRGFNSTWLGRIVRRPGRTRRDIEPILADVSFVVFNYDRLIEQYIKLYCRYALNISDEDCDRIANNMNIAHAYGHLAIYVVKPQSVTVQMKSRLRWRGRI